MKRLVALLAGCMLMGGVAFAGQTVNGTASATSGVSGSVSSSNKGNDGSFAIERAGNTSYAGFGTTKNGNSVSATTYGGSTGYTFGYANDGKVKGSQNGSFSATAHISIPSHR